MKFASIRNGERDGALALVSRDLSRAVMAVDIAPTLQAALERWQALEPVLRQRYELLDAGRAPDSFAFDPARALAPLPRAYQFVDASAFLNHGNIMEEAYRLTVKKTPGVPILVQRQSDDFLGAQDDYPFPQESDQGDFEGEVAVVLDDVPMGVDPGRALSHVRLLMLFNDMSMRAHLFRELSMGFGFIQAKPSTAFAPVAVTPDELGAAWSGGRVALDLHVSRNGEPFGHPNGREMDFGFGELVAHLAYNRNLRAGTILGSGTFSNRNHRAVGSACLAERRAVEVIDQGAPRTPFLAFGERLRFEMFGEDGRSVFGAIDHRMVPAKAAA
ncbi:fumarylacetoacetate hydrolase family protein [Castellaniella defragrans]|uniref:Fumarylacetoacetate (FAA) hydrolase n=1 Tax=Castellaniella defragrans TaxID=75697 RepID=A0A7W9WP39_CASDE|nr:fumarylacetoacetate hydrolase family protein [Castellaniella defragrans]KAB0622269.1 fumarylacetoacetate hydrolase [Castellaniella defragrans]MBB6084198.1 fumarylacetoacetate (FAA) hydrolase [Castellaniella defragrans]